MVFNLARCRHMITFWDSFANWWNTMCNNCDTISETDIMLGQKGNKVHTIQLNLQFCMPNGIFTKFKLNIWRNSVFSYTFYLNIRQGCKLRKEYM